MPCIQYNYSFYLILFANFDVIFRQYYRYIELRKKLTICIFVKFILNHSTDGRYLNITGQDTTPLLVYNRILKTGSSGLLQLLVYLEAKNDFHLVLPDDYIRPKMKFQVGILMEENDQVSLCKLNSWVYCKLRWRVNTFSWEEVQEKTKDCKEQSYINYIL